MSFGRPLKPGAKKIGKIIGTGGAFGLGEKIVDKLGDKIVDTIFGESKPDTKPTPAADTSGPSSTETKGSPAPTPTAETSGTGSQATPSGGTPNTKS